MIDPNLRVRLGKTNSSVFPLTLGGMAMSGVYRPSDDAESVATIRQATSVDRKRGFPPSNVACALLRWERVPWEPLRAVP